MISSSLRALRVERGLTLEAVAVLSDVDVATVSRPARPGRTSPRHRREARPVSVSPRSGCNRFSPPMTPLSLPDPKVEPTIAVERRPTCRSRTREAYTECARTWRPTAARAYRHPLRQNDPSPNCPPTRNARARMTAPRGRIAARARAAGRRAGRSVGGTSSIPPVFDLSRLDAVPARRVSVRTIPPMSRLAPASRSSGRRMTATATAALTAGREANQLGGRRPRAARTRNP